MKMFCIFRKLRISSCTPLNISGLHFETNCFPADWSSLLIPNMKTVADTKGQEILEARSGKISEQHETDLLKLTAPEGHRVRLTVAGY